MLYTSQTQDNSTFDDCLEKLYSEEKFNAIVRFLKVRISPYARAVGDTLLVAGLEKDFETDLTINEIASNSGVSRSMTIQSLKLLVDLQIFHKQEEINKPCTYKFNPGEWLQYSTPEPRKKVVRIFGEDAGSKEVGDRGGSENDSCSPPDTPQEQSINAYPEPMNEGDVVPAYEQPHLDYASDPLFAQAHTARMEALKSKPQKVLKIKDGDWFWEMPCNTDVDSGKVIDQIIEKEGITVQRAVAQVVKLAKKVMDIFAELKIPFKITESPEAACEKLLAAIAKKQPIVRDEFKERRIGKVEKLEDYYQKLQKLGYAKQSVKLSECNGQINLVPIGGVTPQPVAIADLMKNHSDPSATLRLEYYTFAEVIENYERGSLRTI